ncbi:MAG: hypothetical protein K2W95_08055 [Candidatus Obscuribacterales bacterium]|nr:hypothetical protein [Candidatus Obscuribacterales bacterium]
MSILWDKMFDEPVFMLTSDQDWAPEWAAADFLHAVSQFSVPVHLFRTNPSAVFDKAVSDGAGQGWHPNFFPGSSHGTSEQEVIDWLSARFPEARTARSHVFHESSYEWEKLAASGIVADSQVCTVYNPEIQPLLHWTGILRLPVFFEDDVFYSLESDDLDLKNVYRYLFTPGLKILNFHATFVACNIPSKHYYESVKSSIFPSPQPTGIWRGRGTRGVLEELLGTILDKGFHFKPLEELVDDLLSHIENNADRFPRPYCSMRTERTSSRSKS